MAYQHEPVLVEETLRLLEGCRRVLDCTAGGGGHAGRLVEWGAEVLALDKDPAAVAACRTHLAPFGERARVLKLDFVEAASHPEVASFRPDGVLLDLGVSSPQLDDDARGFSFRPGARLDMRMEGPGGAEGTAAWWLNHAVEPELADAFFRYADERRSRRLAREIVRRRANAPFAVSDDLVGAIRAVLGPRSGPADFARLFQAV
ncbi:MAG TPA: 16S rRNA (cytosine(1402)-N(4))-methyltransferase, partial [Gemmatimonadales bacterium]|nr:16S rRNA (cytosine(1402)-N(4))-methyltransferase [Gemmatimonadales bacterium]